MVEIILKNSIHPDAKPFFKRYKKTKYSYLYWTDGTIDDYQSWQLSEIMKPVMDKLLLLFDDSRYALQKKSSLGYGNSVIGHWSGVPNDLADIVELLILEAHKKYMDTRKPTTTERFRRPNRAGHYES